MGMNTYGGLREAMELLARGDGSRLDVVLREAAPALRRYARKDLADMGWASAPSDHVEDVVLDGLLELAAVAKSYDPDRGSPWVFARPRLRHVAARHVGQHHDDLDCCASLPAAEVAVTPAEYPPLDAVLDGLAADNPLAAGLAAALHKVASERDRQVWLEHSVAKASGDASPAVSVSALFGLTNDHVRQIVRRVSQRLRELAAVDVDFAELGAVHALAA